MAKGLIASAVPASITMDKRRAEVTAWLCFVRDFSQIDVESLIVKAAIDDAFIEAVEAVLQSASRPWASFEALRDFCINLLLGERPKALQQGAPRPRHRVTPFSVPMELLRSVFTSQDLGNRFVPGRLRIREESFVLDIPANGQAGWSFLVSPEQMFLLTTIWARVVPPIEPLRHRVEIIDEASLRRQELLLWALVAEPQPLFLPLLPQSSVRMTVRAYDYESAPPMHVLISLEGWAYLGGG